eukprot:scaffold33283_cov143-Skeletonema_menzelii.AAC.3
MSVKICCVDTSAPTTTVTVMRVLLPHTTRSLASTSVASVRAFLGAVCWKTGHLLEEKAEERKGKRLPDTLSSLIYQRLHSAVTHHTFTTSIEHPTKKICIHHFFECINVWQLSEAS